MKEQEPIIRKLIAQCIDCDFKISSIYTVGDLDAFSETMEFIEDTSDIHENRTGHTVNIFMEK
jgi:hypothetical protein